MTPRQLITTALQILAVAAAGALLIHALGWMAATDRQVERASLEAYCQGVVTWQVEASRGIAAEQRTGHPDYEQRAAEDCPGLRPALPAITERQLARN